MESDKLLYEDGSKIEVGLRWVSLVSVNVLLILVLASEGRSSPFLLVTSDRAP
jgi:hypothetical protein